jgi:hypothetical protein
MSAGTDSTGKPRGAAAPDGATRPVAPCGPAEAARPGKPVRKRPAAALRAATTGRRPTPMPHALETSGPRMSQLQDPT